MSEFEEKVRIVRQKSELWDKSQNYETKVRIVRQKSELWDKSQNYETKVRIVRQKSELQIHIPQFLLYNSQLAVYMLQF